MSMRVSVVGVALLSLMGMVVTGCSSPKLNREETVHVKGKLTNGGKPLSVHPAMGKSEGGRPRVSFIRVEESGQPGFSGSAVTDIEGNFEADVPLGKYRVAVQHPYAVPEERELLSKFDQRGSTLEREVTADGQEIVIDLANPNGS